MGCAEAKDVDITSQAFHAALEVALKSFNDGVDFGKAYQLVIDTYLLEADLAPLSYWENRN